MQNQKQHPYRWERAQDLKEERLVKDAFRCDKCQMVKPLPFILQDGGRYCRRCWDVASVIELQSKRSQDASRAAQQPMTPLTLPIVGAIQNAVSVTSIVPTRLVLSIGGASGTVTLKGPNLSSSDTVTTGDSHITISQSVAAGATGFNGTNTLTITAAGGTVAGNYNLVYNGDLLQPRGILVCR